MPAAERARVLLEVNPPGAELGRDSKETQAVRWLFPGECLAVGRAVSADQFVIEHDAAISKSHFEVEFDGQTCVLRDLGSANGTRVNGERVDTSELTTGDTVAAGNTTFVVTILGLPTTD